MKFSPYIIELLKHKSGCDIRLSADCEWLVCDIESVTGEHIGVNTMKRLLGFIDDERTPRVTTLDVVARYLGYDSWDALRLVDANYSNSAFDKRDECLVSQLSVGQKLCITYPPDRNLTIEYHGNNKFLVTESHNSKLLAGDELTLTHIVRGYPLLISEVVRNGEKLGSFIAGKSQGIDFKLL